MAAATSKPQTAKSTKSRRTRRTGRRDPLAVTLLKKDHREVEGWFDEYEQLEQDAEKLALFNKIALALKVHTTIEEEIFYPEERGEVEDDMLDEAYVEHAGAKKLIAEIEAMKPSEEFYDAKVKVLGEYIKHHVKEEEQPGGIFAQAKRGDEDLDKMGERMKVRKQELMAQLGGGKALPAAFPGKEPVSTQGWTHQSGWVAATAAARSSRVAPGRRRWRSKSPRSRTCGRAGFRGGCAGR